MRTNHLSLCSRLPVLLAASLLVLIAHAAAGQPSTTLAKPFPIFDARKVTLKINLDAIATTSSGQRSLFLSWTLTNRSGRAIFVEQGKRMPYVEVTNAGNIDVNYTVKDIRPSRILFFEVPDMVQVTNRSKMTGTMTVGVPVHGSDHYTLPAAAGTPVTSPYRLSLRIGYMTTGFNVPPSNSVILNKFLDRQLEVKSNRLRF